MFSALRMSDSGFFNFCVCFCVQVWHVADGKLQNTTMQEYTAAHSAEMAEEAAAEARRAAAA